MTTAHPAVGRGWLKGRVWLTGRAWLVGRAWLCLTCMLGTQAQTGRNYTTVTFSDGRQLRGELTHTPGAASSSSVARFLGVQYGASPTGKLCQASHSCRHCYHFNIVIMIISIIKCARL